LFGEIKDGEMQLNEFGKIVGRCWYDLSNHYKNMELDCFVIMPNHIHGIINIVGAGLKPAPTDGGISPFKPAPTENHGLPEIIRALKTFSARKINQIRKNPGMPVWQRNYYEHVVRGENDLARIREYIINNPAQWDNDSNNPRNAAEILEA
jgi:REP element-mobilizing transposase RayT